MQTHTHTTYSFADLSDEAKAKALDACRNDSTEHGTEWWDGVYDDVKEVAKILGIEIENIWFSGFCSQGDGAQFVGSYWYAKGSAKAIREHAPKDEELHGIVDTLAKIQRPCFYGLYAYVTHRGHYQHENCTDIDVRDTDDYTTRAIPADDIAECLRDFMRWIYKRLEAEHEYLTSDDAVREHIECNEIEFNEDGTVH